MRHALYLRLKDMTSTAALGQLSQRAMATPASATVLIADIAAGLRRRGAGHRPFAPRK